MSDVEAYLAVALAVVVAIVYPVLGGVVTKAFPPTAGLPPWMKKYGALLLFSLVTALIVLALYRNSNPNSKLNFWTAVALGIGWEATLEKIFTTKP